MEHNHYGHNHDHHDDHNHEHSLQQELVCHLPYAIFSVAFGLAVLSFLSYFSCNFETKQSICDGANILFHSFHFMHIVFAATGAVLTFTRFSRNVPLALVVGVVTPTIFCALSDVVLPYLGGRMLGVDMTFHLCFMTELENVLPFLFVGVLNGLVLGLYHVDRHSVYSLFSHAAHILVSSFASIFYLVAHGFVEWYVQIGFVFLFQVIAVVVPCTLSDVVVPMLVAKAGGKHEKS